MFRRAMRENQLAFFGENLPIGTSVNCVFPNYLRFPVIVFPKTNPADFFLVFSVPFEQVSTVSFQLF